MLSNMILRSKASDYKVIRLSRFCGFSNVVAFDHNELWRTPTAIASLTSQMLCPRIVAAFGRESKFYNDRPGQSGQVAGKHMSMTFATLLLRSHGLTTPANITITVTSLMYHLCLRRSYLLPRFTLNIFAIGGRITLLCPTISTCWPCIFCGYCNVFNGNI